MVAVTNNNFLGDRFQGDKVEQRRCPPQQDIDAVDIVMFDVILYKHHQYHAQ